MQPAAKLLLTALMILTASLSACRKSKSKTNDSMELPEVTPLTSQYWNQGEPTGTTQTLQFHVSAPIGTDRIDLVILTFFDFAELKRLAMVQDSDGGWSTSTTVPTLGLLRYRYERSERANRETLDAKTNLNYRILWVDPLRTQVEDVIAGWLDQNSFASTGTVQGRVTDRATGEGIKELTVSIGGVHIPTLADGSFSWESAPVGRQRVTVFSESGHYHSKDQDVLVTAGGVATADFSMKAAQAITLKLIVKTPADVPSQALLHVSGNLDQVGSTFYYLNFKYPEHGLRAVMLEATGDGRQSIELTAFEGSYLEFHYTFGGDFINQERTSDGPSVIRYVIPGSESMTLTDSPVAFHADGEVALDFRIKIPSDLDLHTFIMSDQSGGSHYRVWPEGDRTFGMRIYTNPSDTPFSYRYTLGGTHEVYGDNAFRSVVAHQQQLVQDEITAWRAVKDSADLPAYPIAPSSVVSRPSFAGGVFLLDYWTADFLPLFEGTMKQIKTALAHANTITITQIIDLETIDPPLFRFRSIRSGSVRTPKSDLDQVLASIHAAGYQIFLQVTPNPEMALDASSASDSVNRTFEPHSNAWFNAWMSAMDKFYLDAENTAKHAQVEYLFLPQTDLYAFQDDSYKATVNQWMLNTIQRLRSSLPKTKLVGERYNNSNWSWYDQVDFIGYKVWENLGVSANPTTAEIKTKFDSLLDTNIKPLADLHGKPIILTQIAFASVNDAANRGEAVDMISPDKDSIVFNATAQAQIYDALMQSIAERSWVQGIFPFGYHFTPLNASKDYSIRGKPAEAVLNSWFGAFGL